MMDISAIPEPEVVTFPSGTLTLKGLLWKPPGEGKFPAILFNHGSEPAAPPEAYGRVVGWFLQHGYVFLLPYRRGHGLSADQGTYIGTLLNQTEVEHGKEAWSKLLVELHEGDHLDDQLAALTYLKSLPFVDTNRMVIGGASFGGIQTVLAAELDLNLRGALDFAGGAMAWAHSPHLQARMVAAAQNARCPIFFIQAENDFDLSPSRVLAAEMEGLGKPHRIAIFPPFGETVHDGHRFCVLGGAIWEEAVFAFLDDVMQK
ncbi:MAG: dienelactone hydrolase family protein [bacterium]|nr:dienelactone hydrolase family protein [bacterium]